VKRPVLAANWKMNNGLAKTFMEAFLAGTPRTDRVIIAARCLATGGRAALAA
jgi:hypothetical protein